MATIVAAPAVQAGSPTGTPIETGKSQTIGAAHGLVYRTAHSSVQPTPGQSLGVAVECRPATGRHTIGGGAAIPGGAYGEALTASGPIPGFPQARSWVGSFHNRSGTHSEVWAFAICTKLEDRKLVTETLRDALADKEHTLKARCPGDSRVSSGGISFDEADGQWRVSKPFDGRDDNSKPDDGWRVSAYPHEVTDIRAYAICVAGERLSYRTEVYDGLADSSYEAQSFCGENGAVVGGGGSISGGGASSYADGTYPGDFGRPNGVPDDYWGFRTIVAPGGPHSVTSIAICKR